MAPAQSAQEIPRIIGKSSGVSIALVVVIIGVVIADLNMMSTLNERVSGFGINLTNQGDDLVEIKNSVRELATSTRSELTTIRNENMSLRERVTKLEALMDKR